MFGYEPVFVLGKTRPEWRNAIAQRLNSSRADDPLREVLEKTLIWCAKQENFNAKLIKEN